MTCDHPPDPCNCRACWKRLNDKAYWQASGGAGDPPRTPDCPEAPGESSAASLPMAEVLVRKDCVNLGGVVEFCHAPNCVAELRHVRSCLVHDKATLGAGWPGRNPSVKSCVSCDDYTPPREEPAMRWACGLTTVPKRRGDLLPRTLASLRLAGFSDLRLFVDGEDPKHHEDWQSLFGLPCTFRTPKVNVYANWMLGIAELFVRCPDADAYAMFQDDLVAVRNLRQYLERAEMPAQSYLNLYTVPANHAVAKGRRGWHEVAERGKGALGLVFSREALLTLLSNHAALDHLAKRPLHPTRGWRALDGGVHEAMAKAGWREVVHNPSLVQHAGKVSAMNKHRRARGHEEEYPEYQWPERAFADSFPGEGFDALTLLEGAGARSEMSRDEWQREVAALERAIAEDELRAAQAESPSEWARYGRIIQDYKVKLVHARSMAEK